MNRTRTSNILLIAGIAVLFAGTFLTILVPASLLLLLAAVAIRPGTSSRRSPKIMLAAVLFTGLAIFGFYILYATWGTETLGYSLIGYVILFGPFLSSMIAFTFLLAYFIDRSRRYDDDRC